MNTWRDTVIIELERRCGADILLLFADKRTDPVFNKNVERWVLVARDTSFQQVQQVTGDLFRRMPSLAESLNVRVAPYTHVMDWGTQGWPEWLLTLDKAVALIPAGEPFLKELQDRHVKGTMAVDLPALAGAMEAQRKRLEVEFQRKFRSFVVNYYQLVMLEVQANYLRKYPQMMRNSLANLGSPELLMKELKLEEDNDLRQWVQVAESLSSELQSAQPVDSILEQFKRQLSQHIAK